MHLLCPLRTRGPRRRRGGRSRHCTSTRCGACREHMRMGRRRRRRLRQAMLQQLLPPLRVLLFPWECSQSSMRVLDSTSSRFVFIERINRGDRARFFVSAVVQFSQQRRPANFSRLSLFFSLRRLLRSTKKHKPDLAPARRGSGPAPEARRPPPPLRRGRRQPPDARRGRGARGAARRGSGLELRG